MMKKFIKYAVGIIIPLAAGGVSALLTSGQMQAFEEISKPAFSPPAFLFPIAWSILYVLMGISSVMIYESGSPEKRKALTVYGIQLAVNFFWSIFFFGFGLYFFSFLWLILLWILVLYMIILFAKIKSSAAYLNYPYLLWLTFAGYLSCGVWLLNK